MNFIEKFNEIANKTLVPMLINLGTSVIWQQFVMVW